MLTLCLLCDVMVVRGKYSISLEQKFQCLAKCCENLLPDDEYTIKTFQAVAVFGLTFIFS